MHDAPYPERQSCPVCEQSFRPSKQGQITCSRECGASHRHLKRLQGEPTKVVRGYRWCFVLGCEGAPSLTRRAGAWKLEHRLVMENLIGRRLRSDEHVHHVNEDTLDNRPENLRILSRVAHSKLHKSAPPPRSCEWCGKPINWPGRPDVRTCSVSHGKLLQFHGLAAAPVNGGAGSPRDRIVPRGPNFSYGSRKQGEPWACVTCGVITTAPSRGQCLPCYGASRKRAAA